MLRRRHSLVELTPATGKDTLPAHRFRNGDLARAEPFRKGNDLPSRSATVARGRASGDATGADGELAMSGVIFAANEKRIVLAVDDKIPDDILDRPVRLYVRRPTLRCRRRYGAL